MAAKKITVTGPGGIIVVMDDQLDYWEGVGYKVLEPAKPKAKKKKDA